MVASVLWWCRISGRHVIKIDRRLSVGRDVVSSHGAGSVVIGPWGALPGAMQGAFPCSIAAETQRRSTS